MSACRCNGSGYIVTCCDDICRAVGSCMHGDGDEVCPCQWDESDDPEDDEELPE